MSPSLTARFPWYTRIFGGRQGARSIHFLCLCAFTLFIIVHVTLVVLHGLGNEFALIVLGETQTPNIQLALIVGLAGLAGIVAFHVVATVYSLRYPRLVQRRTQAVTERLRRALFGHAMSEQHYSAADVSPCFRVNGRPPGDAPYAEMAREEFRGYVLEVGGLVEQPLRLSLQELRAMPKQTQVTKHCCIQGWSAIAEWSGIPLSHIIGLCRPLASARFAVFYAFDDKSTSEPHPAGPGLFYGTLEMELARHPQTILAYEMNGLPLPVPHGAPLRLRVETQLGFSMVKYVRRIDFVDDYLDIGEGHGGWREDHQYYSQEAGI